MDNFKTLHMEADLSAPICRKNVGLVMGSGDGDAGTFSVSLTRQGQPVSLDDCTVTGYLILPNDETLRISGFVKDNRACVTIPKSGCLYDGGFTLSIKTVVGGCENTVAVFDGIIGRTTSGNITDGEKVLYGANEILNLIDAMEKAQQDAQSAAGNALTAAQDAQDAAQAAQRWGDMTAEAQPLPPGSPPTVTMSGDGLVFGIPRGETGLPFLIKGDAFSTLAALQAGVTNPEVGDQYNVGTSAPYSVYRWTGSKWENQGQLGSAAIDATLTQSGQAADAKAAGEALKQKLPLAGGTLTGNLTMESQNYLRLRINRSIDGVKHGALLAVSSDGAVRISKNNEETEKNYLVLREGETVFGKPVTIAGGGTGAATAKEAEYNISGGISEVEDAVTDNIGIVCARGTPSPSAGVFYKRKASNLWAYIAGKIRSVFGFSQLGVLPAANGGTGKTSLADVRSALGVSTIDFTDSVTFNTQKNFAHFRCMGEMAFVQYQSQSAAIDVGTVLFTLPETGFRPVDRYTPVPFVVDGTAYGRALIDNTTGECKVTRISSAATGVVVINMTYHAGRPLEI